MGALLMAELVNDVHSRLNSTEVARVEWPRGVGELCAVVRRARERGESLSVCGARHAMGGQQFLSGGVLVDMRSMARVLEFDRARGLLRVEAGADWPAIIAATREGGGGGWGIRQKQTGADAMTLGGSIACNAHGRGLAMGPLVEDIEALTLVTADGEAVGCSRDENADLFALAVGGYGLMGIVADATLRLVERRPMRRLVDIIDIDDALGAVRRRAAEGCCYGDFQYAIDAGDESFLRRGVFACYQGMPKGTAVADDSADLSREAWLELLRLAHTDKRRAFALYSQHYLETHGRVYWSDTMQLGTYIPTYAEFLAGAMGSKNGPGESLMITELYVPPESLIEFMSAARVALRATGVEDIYGTIRSVRKDTTTFLPWARQDSACVIFNLRTAHDEAGVARSRDAARRLIDAAAGLGGTFYLTYHRWATREQLLRCHPRLPEFLARKRELDPRGVFQSDWYRGLVATLDGAA
jgi:FAD/FMN-containing dehydrogenase